MWFDSPAEVQISLLSDASKLALRSTKPWLQWVQRPRREADHSYTHYRCSWSLTLYDEYDSQSRASSEVFSCRLIVTPELLVPCRQCIAATFHSATKEYLMVRKTPKLGNTCTFGTGPRETKENHQRAEHHAAMSASWTGKGFRRKCSLPNRDTTEQNHDNPTGTPQVPVERRTRHLPITLPVHRIHADLYNRQFNRPKTYKLATS
jgi:hypothetical protein